MQTHDRRRGRTDRARDYVIVTTVYESRKTYQRQNDEGKVWSKTGCGHIFELGSKFYGDRRQPSIEHGVGVPALSLNGRRLMHKTGSKVFK